MVSAGSYVVSALALAAVGLSLGFTAFTLRQRLLPAWEGAPARLVEAVVGIALLIWLGEVLGTVGLFYAWVFVVSSLLAAAVAAWRFRPSQLEQRHLPGGGADLGDHPEEAAPAAPAAGGGSKSVTGPADPTALQLQTLDLQQLLDRIPPVLAPVPRLLVAAKRSQRVEGPAVDLDLPGANLLRHADRAVLVS